jgi:outer membrane biosynthesis protein TonB
MEYKEENNYPKAFIATGLIVAAILALCYFIVFDVPAKPVEGTGGILVNYGTTDAGMGTDYTSTEQPSVAEKANHVKPTRVTPAPPTEQKTSEESTDKKILTQNNEDAPEVTSNAKKPSTAVSTQATKTMAKPTINQNALYKGKSNGGTGAGDGTTNTPGNQGNPNGSTLTNNYNGNGSGNGGNIGLGNRSFISRPKVADDHRASGRIYIECIVDKNGNISQVSIGRGTTITDDVLIERCINAVKDSKVTPDDNAPDQQKVRIPFVFILK